MRRKLFAITTAFIALSACIALAEGESYEPVRVAGFPDDVYAEILPEIELLSGVLSQTSWIKTRGPKGAGNTYFRELRAFFAPFRGHEAVKLAEKLTRIGFNYDAPPCFLVSLGPLPELAPLSGYSDYLLQRANGRENLERFRQALADLARESGFQRFFAAHRPEYVRYLAGSVTGFRSEAVIGWWQAFSGSSGDEYHLVLAPAMFPGGGYGSTVTGADGRPVSYQFIREGGASQAEPEFPSGQSLESLALHEWGHSFVNPALAKHAALVRQLEPLFRPVKKVMQQQAYGSVETFLNEQVLRAATTLASGDLYGSEARARDLAYHEQRGFYLTAFTVAELERYRTMRDKYAGFVEFVPELLGAYLDHREQLLPAR